MKNSSTEKNKIKQVKSLIKIITMFQEKLRFCSIYIILLCCILFYFQCEVTKCCSQTWYIAWWWWR